METWEVILLCLSFSVIPADASSWTAVVPSSVKGLLGSCVFIPCSYNYPDPGRMLTHFTGIWTDETNHIIYHPDGSKTMQQFRGRTKLLGDLSHKNCSLSISPLQSADTGPFHFRIEIADFNKFSFKAQEVSVTVINTPEPISLSVQEVAEEGIALSAFCTASHFCPTAHLNFTWNHDGTQQIQLEQRHFGQWVTTSQLVFHPTPFDHEKTLECSVTYEGGHHLTSTKLLKVKYAPVDVEVDYKPIVREGERVQLTCSSNAYPAAHSYQWHDDSGSLLFRGRTYTLSNVSRSTGTIHCTAFNTEGEGDSDPVLLNILYPPQMKMGSTCSMVRETLTCVCIAESKPPSVIQFLLPDRLLPSSQSERHGGSVTIGTLQGDFGSPDFVHCVANNTEGSCTLALSIPAHNHSQILNIALGIGACLILIGIFTTALIKCRQSSENKVESTMQGKEDVKSVAEPKHSIRKTTKKFVIGGFSNIYTNDVNMQDVWAVDDNDDDEAVYANLWT